MTQDCIQLTLLHFPSMLHIFFDDPEDLRWAWGKLLSDTLDVHVPVTRSISKRQHVPFMTPELLGSTRHRNKLKKLYFESEDPGDWEKYRLQRNLTSSLRRREISSYISGQKQIVPKVIQNNSGIQLSPLCIVNEVTMKGPITLRRMAYL